MTSRLTEASPRPLAICLRRRLTAVTCLWIQESPLPNKAQGAVIRRAIMKTEVHGIHVHSIADQSVGRQCQKFKARTEAGEVRELRGVI